MTGHLLGAAGGLEAGITALAVYHQIAPPTINLDQPDPRLRPRLRAALQARPLPITYALSNSFGFGGTNAALLFKKIRRVSGLASDGHAVADADHIMKIAVCIKQVRPASGSRA